MKSYIIRVRPKGQLTLPVELRRRFNLTEGSLLEAEPRENGILLKPLPPIKGGKVVGEKYYGEVLKDLERLREGWR